MGPFEMVVAIVAVVTIGNIIRTKVKYQGTSTAAGGDSADAARLREEIRSLKERVQVLERVITDNEGSLRLDREIERLRDRNQA